MHRYEAATRTRLMRKVLLFGDRSLLAPSRATADHSLDGKQRQIDDHNRNLRAVEDNYSKFDFAASLHKSFSVNIKSAAAYPAPVPLDRCKPILVSELRPGVTHRGRVLRGRLVVKPIFMTGLMTLLEDENGDLTRLALYNLLPSGLSGMAGLVAAAKLLPVGREVAVLEPYFKIMLDGSAGVRVDNPAELVVLDSGTQRVATDLQSEGQRHLQAGEYTAAADWFRHALLRLPNDTGTGTELLITCLLNISATALKLGDAQTALATAAAASAMQPDAAKPHYCMAAAATQASPSLAMAARCELHRAGECMRGAGGGSSGGSGGKSFLRSKEWEQMVAEVGPVPAVKTTPTAVEVVQASNALLLALAGIESPLLSLKCTAAAITTATASTVTAAMSAASVANKTGDVAFKASMFESAREHYMSALKILLEVLPAADLLTSLAECHLQLGNLNDAVMGAKAAQVLNPYDATACTHLANALMRLGCLAEAKVACVAGLAAVPPAAVGHGALLALHERICTASAVETDAKMEAGDRRWSPGVVTERAAKAREEPADAVEKTFLMNKFMDMVRGDPESSNRMKSEQPLMWRSIQRDTRVPAFHEEFTQAGRWPPGCDMEEGHRRLWQAYELCTSSRMHMFLMAAEPDPGQMLMKRMGVVHPTASQSRVQWLLTARDGTVSSRWDSPIFKQRDAVKSAYNPTIFHSFSNSPTLVIPMTPTPRPAHVPEGESCGGSSSGSANSGYVVRTHVAVGFVDLSTLAVAVNMPEWDEHVDAAERELAAVSSMGGRGGGSGDCGKAGNGGGSSTASPPPQPLLRWVGVEASPHSVAKSLIVERMLRTGGPAATDLVLQVWYSSAWTQQALDAFRTALAALLREQQQVGGQGKLPAVVLSYLRHWQLNDVSLSESRRRWLADLHRSCCVVGEFTEKSDRLAVSEYILTGQLPGLGDNIGSKLVGSVTMFANPKGGAERSLDECFLETIPFEEVVAARLGRAPTPPPMSQLRPEQQQQQWPGGAYPSRNGGEAKGTTVRDVVSAGVEILQARVRRLAALQATGRVEVQINLMLVEPGDSQATAFISSLSPASISWSNIPDYYSPTDFHNLARACSASAAATQSGSTPGSTLGSATGTGLGAVGHPQPSSRTRHYLTSMNWLLDVKGACHLDITLPLMMAGKEESGRSRGFGGRTAGGRGSARRERHGESEKKVPSAALSEAILKLVEEGEYAARQDIVKYGKTTGSGSSSSSGSDGGGLVFDPPVTNPRNIADFGLYMKHHQTWAKEFLKAAEEVQQRSSSTRTSRSKGARAGGGGTQPSADPVEQVVLTPPVYAPFNRTHSTISLAYSYN